jgi:threonine aldolase
VSKEAALFVPSGTMGNLLSVMTHARRGQEIILGDESHIFVNEAGGASALGGLIYHPVRTASDGTLALDAIEAALHPSGDPHYAEAALICLENTHNRCGGRVLSPDYVRSVATFAGDRGIAVHLDGARIFNASIARRRPVSEWTRHVASVQFCVSKGLAAPAGSLIAADRPFVERARRLRKMLGGGMRQVGVLAAAGIVALTEMVDRLAEDHANARILADGLAGAPGLALEPSAVETNIVIFELADGIRPDALLRDAAAAGVLLGAAGRRRIRAVTHYGITADECRRAADAIAGAAKSQTATA